MQPNTIIQGDCIDTMKKWPAKSINCCVTSPPYWGLRDYGVNGQLGLEKTPEEFVAKMVAVFAEVKRVLRDDGTLWLNLGDSYAGGKIGRADSGDNGKFGGPELPPTQRKPTSGMKPKDLCGIPWMVAFALRQDGWYLRQDIIWHKPNPMPESVRDRCTKAHEYIFLLTKKPRYYYDAEAIKVPAVDKESYKGRKFRGPKAIALHGGRPNSKPNTLDRGCEADGKTFEKVNKRSVWTVTTKPYSEAHFATFPPDLIEPCILAGCPKEVCPKCGKPRVRIIERTATNHKTMDYMNDAAGGAVTGGTGKNFPDVQAKTTGWTDCGCNAGFEPGLVLDPFMGSGTTAMVAYENNRNYVGCELNPEYIKLNRADIAKENYALFEK